MRIDGEMVSRSAHSGGESGGTTEIHIMTTQQVTLTNSFHGSEITLRAKLDARGVAWLSAGQVRKARRALCGMSDCSCGGDGGCRPAQIETQPDGSARIL